MAPALAAGPKPVAAGQPVTAAAPASLLLRKFTVDEYHLMAKAGVFVDGDPFELLNGWIVQKMTRNTPHDVAVQILGEVLGAVLPVGWGLRIQCAITVMDSEPEPDGAVVRGRARDYLAHHPLPPDIGLVVEIADTSLNHDRTVKGPIYARAAVGLYWIINLVDAQIEVYSVPSGDVSSPAYRQLQTFRAGQAVPLVLDGQPIAAIPVQDLLP